LLGRGVRVVSAVELGHDHFTVNCDESVDGPRLSVDLDDVAGNARVLVDDVVNDPLLGE
jgi:hypothetical protein